MSKDFTPYKIQREKTALLVIDIQEKLVKVMDQEEWELTEESILNLIHLAKLYKLPTILTEQYPKGLGKTISSVQKEMAQVEKIEKLEFSACANESFLKALQKLNILPGYHVVVVGLEAHICVYQTVLDLLEKGYHVVVPNDGILSRKYEDMAAGLDLMEQAGAVIASSEMVIFQLLGKAGTDEFKEMSKRIK